MFLSAAEKEHFVERGYIVRRLDLDPAQIALAIDLAWRNLDPRLKRDDPSTWVGDVQDSCRVACIASRRGHMKLRECVWQDPLLNAMIYKNSEIDEIILDLLGPKGGPYKHIRGIYPVFPSPESSVDLEGGGMDGHDFQINCNLYLSDVAPNGGAFTLWEGSHKIMRFAFDGNAAWKLNAGAPALMEMAARECRHVELTGPAGTAIFWHHRLLHMPSTNHTPNIRFALLADFVQHDWASKFAEPHKRDMWEDWAVSPSAGQRHTVDAPISGHPA